MATCSTSIWKTGSGARKLVVFADPNCGYCKKFERDLQAVKDVTVYTFLYPILGGDSPEKSKAIWCAKDSTKTWRDWMIKGTPIPESSGQCDTSALERNHALGTRYRITLASGISEEVATRVKLGYLPLAGVDIEAARRDPDTLVVEHAGRDLYLVEANP